MTRIVDAVNSSNPPKPATGRPRTRSECGHAGVMARLMNEDWTAMTAAARSSPEHVAGMDRWRRLADQAHPDLTPEQRERLAEKLRHQHYVKMGQLSAAARKLARQAQAEMAAGGDAA